MSRFVVVVFLLAACGQPAAPVKPEPRPEPPIVETPKPPKRPAREAFAVAPSPTSIAVAGNALVWTDAAGSIWTMPTTGGTPRQISDQKTPDFAFKVVATANGVVASTRKDLLRIDLAGGATKQNLALAEYPEDIIADEAAVYVTLFKKPQILRITTTPQQIGELARGILAVHGDTLYAASYATGVLVAMPKTGGKPRTIAKGLVRPTAIAVDATHAYVYSEKEQVLRAIDLATGADRVIAKQLVNSDELVIDGEWLYTRSWDSKNRGSLVRIAKDGSAQQAIATDLAAPYNIAFDADAIYVTARDAAQIVRFEKAALSSSPR